MLRIGQVAEGDAVDGLIDIIVIGVKIIKAHRDNIIRHGGPMLTRGINACSALVIAVVVGQAEHPEAKAVQRIGDLTGGGEHRVAAGGESIIDQRFLIEPVYIELGVEVSHVLIGKGKVIVVAAALLGLQEDAVMDQVIPRGRKAHGLHDRLRLGGRLRCGSWLNSRHRLRFHSGQGLLLIADTQQRAGQHTAHAQRNHQTGGDVVSLHSHNSLPRSRSVMV